MATLECLFTSIFYYYRESILLQKIIVLPTTHIPILSIGSLPRKWMYVWYTNKINIKSNIINYK